VFGWVGGWEEPRALGSIIIIVDIDDGDGLVQKEAVVSFVEHTGGIIAEGCMDMNIMHHGVAVLSAHHPDVAELHFAMRQRHGPASVQISSTNLQRFNACLMDGDAHGVAQNFRGSLRFREGTVVAAIE
jgi:hypothetical protein